MQHERRLAQPGHDAARENVRPPGHGLPGFLQRDPLIHQRTRVSAGDAGFGGAQVAQPAETEQLLCPFVGRRRHFERRAAVANHHLAGESEAAGINLGRARGVGGAQILRRDHQAVGFGRQKAPAQQRVGVEPADKAAQRPAHQQPGQLGVLGDGDARHGRVAFRWRGPRMRPVRAQGIAKRRRWANPPIIKEKEKLNAVLPLSALQPGGIEAIHSGHSRRRDRAGGRAGCADRLGASASPTCRIFPPPRSDGAGTRRLRASKASIASSPSSGSSEHTQ